MPDIRITSALRVARAKCGLTQAELAKRVAVTRQTIGLIKVEKHNPTSTLCLMRLRETGTSVDSLFSIKE